jgi:O-antigen/teichoic acid export membrane protein
LDVFLINRWLSPTTVGVYALALSLSSKAEIVNHSLYTVLIPTASALKSKPAVRRHLRSGLIRSGLVSLVLLALVPIAQWFIPFVYGEVYEPAADLFTLMLFVVIEETTRAAAHHQ